MRDRGTLSPYLLESSRLGMDTPLIVVIVVVPAIAGFVVFVLLPWLQRHDDEAKRR